MVYMSRLSDKVAIVTGASALARVAQTLLLMSASRTVLRAGMPTAMRRTRSPGDAYIYRDVCATLEISSSALRETQTLNCVSAPAARSSCSVR